MFKIKKEKLGVANSEQIVGSFEQVITSASENIGTLIVGGLIVIGIAVAVAGFFVIRHNEESKAAEVLHDGTKVFAQSSGGVPSQDQLQKAAESFRKVLADYPRTAAAPQAEYMLGNTLSSLKDWSGAITAYQEFLTKYRNHQLLLPLVYQRMAYAYLSSGKVDDAQKAFENIVKLSGAPNRDHALYELAKLEEMQQKSQDALSRYQEIAKAHPHSPYAEEAQLRIKMLEAKNHDHTAPASGQPAAATPVPATQGTAQTTHTEHTVSEKK